MPRAKHMASDAAAETLVTAPGRPKGEQIREALTKLVMESRAGSLLPSERVLAERFGVARMTVRGSIDALEVEGLVRRVPGRGTFVEHPTLIHSEILRSFSEDMRLRGMVPGARNLRGSVRSADRDVAERLGVEPGDEIFHLERVRTADGTPMALERTNLSAAKYPGLLDAMSDETSLYEVLGAQFGIRLESAEQTVSIATLTAADARKLEVAAGTPAFLVERLSIDNMGNCVEFGRSLYRGDRYAIKMHVSKPAS
ncbi:GntR family transcriptional regulator [Mumia sp. DW29H23]|uniref:GntR family transcriptional regulator n=1 Tax=Mumia sp. DW29H23 TaxID=3421241 RepID=UPI003D68A96B